MAKNIKHLARRIVHEHTEAMMKSIELTTDNYDDLYENMVEGCAFILSEKLLDGKITPMEYNDIRNELCNTLWSIFEQYMGNS